MSRKGICSDHAFMGSFWSGFKYETIYHQRFATRAEVGTAIFDYIEDFHNRPQTALQPWLEEPDQLLISPEHNCP